MSSIIPASSCPMALTSAAVSKLRVEDTIPEGFGPPELAEEPQLTAPGIDPEMIAAAAKRVLG